MRPFPTPMARRGLLASRTSVLSIFALLLWLPGCLWMPAKGNSAPVGGGVQPTATTSEETEESASANGGGGGAAPAGPELDSLTLHSDCATTVKLFVGEKPKFGSGTNTSIAQNNTDSFTLQAGKSIWIVSATDDGVAEYVGVPGTHRVKIPASCSEFVAD